MYCHSCGAEIPSNIKYCIHCGVKIEKPATAPSNTAQSTSTADQPQPQSQPYSASQVSYTPAQPYVQPSAMTTPAMPQSQPADGCIYSRDKSGGLLLAALVFNVISCIIFAFSIIGLAWAIPMTVHSYGIWKGKKPNTTAFGICTLLFLSFIGGILMLVAEKDQ